LNDEKKILGTLDHGALLVVRHVDKADAQHALGLVLGNEIEHLLFRHPAFLSLTELDQASVACTVSR